MDKYTTIQGDMWDVIAHRLYKDEALMHLIIEANPDYRDIVVFPANCVLNIPDVPKSAAGGLPLWRLGNG